MKSETVAWSKNVFSNKNSVDESSIGRAEVFDFKTTSWEQPYRAVFFTHASACQLKIAVCCPAQGEAFSGRNFNFRTDE
jgi:hypothetical protein